MARPALAEGARFSGGKTLRARGRTLRVAQKQRPPGQGDRDAAQAAGASVTQAARDAPQSSATRSVAAAPRRCEKGRRSRIRVRKNSSSRERRTGLTCDFHVSHRQNETESRRTARWPLSASQQSYGRRSGRALEPVRAVDPDRECLPFPEKRVGGSAHLSSTRTSDRRARSDRFSCLLSSGHPQKPAPHSRPRPDAGSRPRKARNYSDGRSLDSHARRALAGAAATHAAGARCAGSARSDPDFAPIPTSAAHQVLATANRCHEPVRLVSGAISKKAEGICRMRWLTLESKMLSAVAYDGSKQLLYLRFRNTGDVYRYFHFPAAEYQAFLGAESKGRFFRSQIRDHFRYERMAKLHAA